MFAWRGYHEILPTTKGLFRRNVSSHSNCPLCGFSEDSNAHAVFWCPISQNIWELLDYEFLVGKKENISFKGILFYASEILERDDYAKLLVAAWGVWMERNKITHGNQRRTDQQFKIWLSLYYDEMKNTNKMGTTSREVISRGCNVEVDIHESALFVDAAISTDLQKIGLGAVIVTSNKKIQATMSKPLEGSLTVLHAEALAMLIGLNWATTSGFPVKTIFSDSLTVVQALNNNAEYYNEFGLFLRDIRGLLVMNPGTSVIHVRRNFNVAAHNMAKQALQLEDEAIWLEDFPLV